MARKSEVLEKVKSSKELKKSDHVDAAASASKSREASQKLNETKNAKSAKSKPMKRKNTIIVNINGTTIIIDSNNNTTITRIGDSSVESTKVEAITEESKGTVTKTNECTKDVEKGTVKPGPGAENRVVVKNKTVQVNCKCCCRPLCICAMAKITVGIISLYYNNCPMEKMIPIWLIVTGSISIVSHLINACFENEANISRIELSFPRKPVGCSILYGLLVIAMVVWLVFGAIYVFGSYNEVNFNKNSGAAYCHKGVYIFSLVTVSFPILLIPIALCCACLSACCS